ncbi:MAG: hypothetical protein M0Z95_00800 [Actinomycetota bacterium]|jgi:hypothetical protein|nr:hypothetical protein [Actinomycetota bacterium]
MTRTWNRRAPVVAGVVGVLAIITVVSLLASGVWGCQQLPSISLTIYEHAS